MIKVVKVTGGVKVVLMKIISTCLVPRYSEQTAQFVETEVYEVLRGLLYQTLYLP